MKIRACRFSLALLNATVVSLIAAPGAGASPNCDPSTSDGYLNCMGGGIPWQSQSGPSSDTYGPVGVQGFINDNRLGGAFSNLSDETLVKLGYLICQEHAKGVPDKALKAAIMNNGVSDMDAGAIVISAQMYLC